MIIRLKIVGAIILAFAMLILKGQGLSGGLIANYPFAGTYLDYSQTSNNGINLGTTFVSDYCGSASNAVSFSGNSSVTLPHNPNVQIQPPFSYSFRVKFTSYNSSDLYTLYTNNDFLATDAGYKGIYVQYYQGAFYFHITNGASFTNSGRRSYQVNKAIVLNQWYSVSVVIPNYTSCTVYIDCQNQTVSNNGITVASIPYSQNNGTFGRVYYPPTGLTGYFNNQLDDFRMWNRVLSTAELSRLCAQDTSYLYKETCGTHMFQGVVYASPSVSYIPKGTCGGVYKLTLALPAADTLNILDSLCMGDVFVFRGQSYVAPLDTMFGNLNCDTVFNMKLVLLNTDTLNVVADECPGIGYAFRGSVFFAPTDTFFAGITCDTIVHFKLNVKSCDTIVIVDTLCAGQTYAFQGSTYEAPIDTFITSNNGITVYRLILHQKSILYTQSLVVNGCANEQYDTLGFTYFFPFADTIISMSCDTLVYLFGTLQMACDRDCNPFIPNTFTPNNDGTNDFFVLGGGKGPFELKVFNRWGNIVYQSYDYKNDWDGTYKGQPVAEGVYTYHLECKYVNPYGSQTNIDGSSRVYTGYITIFR